MDRLARTWIAAALLLLMPAAAHAADVMWSVSKKNGRVYLGGMPNEPEVDYASGRICGQTADRSGLPPSHVGRAAARRDAEACHRRKTAS